MSENDSYVRCIDCVSLNRNNNLGNNLVGNCIDGRKKGKTLTFKEMIAWRKCKLFDVDLKNIGDVNNA